MKFRTPMVVMGFLMGLASLSVWAKEAEKAPKVSDDSGELADVVPEKPIEHRSSALSFDDELVEGMNRNPFDSLTSVTGKNMKQTSRLYRIKGKFTYEIRATVGEMGYSK